MKQFMVMMILMPILLFFPSQQVADDLNHKKVIAINNIVNKHAQKARVEGYFTTDNLTSMKLELKNALYISEGEVTFTGTRSPVIRTSNFSGFETMQMIDYKVSVPIKKIIAMGGYWNLPDDQNQRVFTVSGQVPSELVP